MFAGRTSEVIPIDTSSPKQVQEEIQGSQQEGEKLTEEEFCESEGLFELVPGTCRDSKGFSRNGQVYNCCVTEHAAPTELSEELRLEWEAIVLQTTCDDYITSLRDCTPFKCEQPNILFPGMYKKGIISMQGSECRIFEELPNDGEQYCRLDQSERDALADYYQIYEQECGEGDCSVVLNESGYFLNGNSVSNELQNAFDRQDCEIFGYY